jgi:hypothetical protein
MCQILLHSLSRAIDTAWVVSRFQAFAGLHEETVNNASEEENTRISY